MARQKLSEEDKKKEFSISINEKLNTILEEYLINKGITNKSKYIENLVKKDLKERGENIETNF